MKKRYILCSIMLLAAVACDDELVEKPYSIAQENFYNTPTEVEAGIAAIYPPLRSAFGAVYLLTMESSTDIFIARDNWGQISLFEGVDAGNRNATEGFWRSFYQGVRNANLIIHSVPNGTALTDEAKAKYVAEARFLRALNYFHLVRGWGGVPLRTDTNMEVVHLKRASVDEVYQLILDDLLFAEGNLPDEPPIAGRASMWTAKAVLADVYFALHENADARDKAKEIIESGKFELTPVTVADDFENVFGPAAGGQTKEEIFHLKFAPESQWGWPRYLTYGTAAEGGGYLIAGGYWIPTGREWMPFYMNWDDNDLRKQHHLYTIDIPGRGIEIISRKFRDPTQQNGTMDYPMYRYSDMLLMYAEAEALVQGAPTTDAMEKLNMVHRRAYGYDPTAASPVDFALADYSTNELFLDLVLDERGKETYSEGKRWYDLLRSGKLQEKIMEAYGIEVKERHLLYPIPAQEMNFNEALTPNDNNPGF